VISADRDIDAALETANIWLKVPVRDGIAAVAGRGLSDGSA
jgi:hypothetical protein